MNMKKKALITGVTGQDGVYLSEFLLSKGYDVHGLKPRESSLDAGCLEQLQCAVHDRNSHFFMHDADMTDTTNLVRLVQQIEPDEIYNLAAQSHVQFSFECPEYTADTDAFGVLRLLEAIRILGMEQKVRFYQASTSDLFGLAKERPQRETTPFYPRSPYACAKLYAYWIVVNYREAYNIHASNGILFNHESPRRSESFVTRKITKAVADIAVNGHGCLYLGNLNVMRDWGFAGDYVKAMWMMLQQDNPGDYVIATGVTTSVRAFVTMAFNEIGIHLEWSGSGINEVGRNALTGEILVRIAPRYFRPTEVDYLLGDASKAHEVLGWHPEVSVGDLVSMMVKADVERARHEKLIRENKLNVSDKS